MGGISGGRGRAAALAALFGVLAASGGSPAEIPPGRPLSRTRAAALLTALIHHNAAGGDEAAPAAGGIGSLSPRRVFLAPEREKILEFARSLIYEGGYFPREIYQLLGYGDAPSVRLARIARQLDRSAGNPAPAPWEAAGRVSRSGLAGAPDNWSMAPGREGGNWLATPGTLAYLPILAVAYAVYPDDGREAAAQLAVLKDDDLRAAPAARAAFSLLANGLIGERLDKDAWLLAASAAGRDLETEQDLRAVRVKDWRYLRGEECAMGRLERAVHLWYKADGYGEILAAGRERLRSSESLAYLAALAAVSHGMESLPRGVIVSGSGDRQLIDLINDLYDLALSEAVLRVAPEGGE